jgi:hypothetical protein
MRKKPGFTAHGHVFWEVSPDPGMPGWGCRDRTSEWRNSILLPYQPNRTSFAPENDANRTQRTRSKHIENSAKSTDAIDLLPLITVWLQVRVLPLASNRDLNQACLYLDHQRVGTA